MNQPQDFDTINLSYNAVNKMLFDKDHHNNKYVMLHTMMVLFYYFDIPEDGNSKDYSK